MSRYRLTLLAAGLIACAGSSYAQNLTPQLKINGFATAGIAWLDEDSAGVSSSGQRYDNAYYMQNSYGRAGIGKDINTKFDSVAGLQLDYAVNDSANMVLQLVAKGQNQDSFKIQADWAYIRYAFNDNWIARFGRLGFQGFMYSDSMMIGQSYPWVRPPSEVYANTPVPSAQGMDLTYRFNLTEKWMFSTQVFAGAADTSDNRLTLKNLGSLYLTLGTDNLTIRGGYMHFNLANNVSLSPLPDLDDNLDDHFSSLGVLYDNGQWLLAGEFVQQQVKGWPADFNAGYFTVGHYFGKWLPYANWGKIVTEGSGDKTVAAAGAPATLVNTRPSSIFEQTSYSLGLRFDPKPNLSFKAQVDHITGMGDYNGMFRYSSANTTGATSQTAGTNAVVGAQTLPRIKDSNLFSLTANVAF